MRAVALLRSEWRDPTGVLAAFADEPFALGLLSGEGVGSRWSYLARRPDATLILSPGDHDDPFSALTGLLGAPSPRLADGPPFQGGIAGLCAYELGDRRDGLTLGRHDGWPDLACARYGALLAFDHERREVVAVGRGRDDAEALGRASQAQAWLAPEQDAAAPTPTGPLAAWLEAESPGLHEAAVAQVVERIARGEIFQANIARRWHGELVAGARPIDLLRRLDAQSPAPFAAYLRLADRAVVSNSPEQFLRISPTAHGFEVETRPIKGTIRRGRDGVEDTALAEALISSAKDRAENLMIVDLMRNDLARVCSPGSVRAPRLFEVEQFANVHHLVSTVTGRLEAGRCAFDLLRAAFPPGSITGAPKIQAMKVIAGLEPPRGPFFGAMIWVGFDGAMDSNVLIRTCACIADQDGWRIEARAGGGVVADSRPDDERRETEAKIAALVRALTQAA